MSSSKINIRSQRDLMMHLLQDMYYAEGKIAKTLPEMAKKAENAELKAGFEEHLEQTRGQIEKLEEVFEVLGCKKEREKCEAIEGLLAEGQELLSTSEKGSTRDSALIAAAQKVEHYEIASYGTLCSLAEKLGEKKAANLLHDILEQEKETDEKLSSIARDIESGALRDAA